MSGGTPMKVRVASRTARVRVRAEAGAPFRLDGRAEISNDDGVVTVDRVRGSVTIVVPEGADLVIGTTTGAVRVAGRLGHVAVSSKTGRVEIDQAASVDVRVTTSKVTVGAVDGTCRIRTASGAVTVGSCGDVDVSTRTGRVRLDAVSGRVAAHSVSGRITIAVTGPYDVTAETVTGRIDVTLPAGTRVGDRRIAGVDQNVDCTVTTRSTTGKVVLAYA